MVTSKVPKQKACGRICSVVLKVNATSLASLRPGCMDEVLNIAVT